MAEKPKPVPVTNPEVQSGALAAQRGAARGPDAKREAGARVAGATRSLERVAPNLEDAFEKSTPDTIPDAKLEPFYGITVAGIKGGPGVPQMRENIVAKVNVKTHLNVRNDDGKVIASLNNGDIITYTTVEQRTAGGYDFVKIKTASGQEGWVADKYLKIDAAESTGRIETAWKKAAEAPAAPAVAAAPAGAPAEKAHEKPEPPEINVEAPPAPPKEPRLPTFSDAKFYEVTDDLDKIELGKYDLRVGEILYATGENGDIIILQKSDPNAKPVPVHRAYLDQLDTGPNDDREKKDAFIADRYEKLPKPDYITSLMIKPEKIKLLDGSRVCILKDEGAGAVRVLRANGEQGVVKSKDLDDADNEEKNSYLVEVYQTLQNRHQQALAKWDGAETERQRATLDLFLANETSPEQDVTARLESELGAGREKFKDAQAEATLAGTTRLIFISPKTGRQHILDITVKQGTIVAVLSKTTDNKYYQVVSPNGFEGYIPASSIKKDTLVARQTPVTAPTITAAASAVAPAA